MKKFQKRIKKTVGKTNTCIVVGNGFGNLSNLLEIFQNIFLLSDKPIETRARNLIYRESYADLTNIMEVNGVFVDLDHVNRLPDIVPSVLRHNCPIMIQGNEPIGRDLSRPLYDHYYNCTDQQGDFHVWRIV